MKPKRVFDPTSRYHWLLTDAESYKHKQVPGTLEHVEFPEHPSDKYYQTKPGDLLHLEQLAYKFYADTRYWWIIAFANNIRDPFQTDDALIALRIPSISRVERILSTLSERLL